MGVGGGSTLPLQGRQCQKSQEKGFWLGANGSLGWHAVLDRPRLLRRNAGLQAACGATSSFCTMIGEQLVSWGKLKASGDNTMYPKVLFSSCIMHRRPVLICMWSLGGLHSFHIHIASSSLKATARLKSLSDLELLPRTPCCHSPCPLQAW